MLLLAIASLSASALAGAAPTTVIEGRITGEDGRPTAKAIALLYKGPQGNPVEFAEADKDGRFTLKTARSGLHILKLAGVGHLPSTALLPLEQAGKIKVEARLQRPAYRGVDWSKARLAVKGAQPVNFQPQPDGTFVAEAATKEAAPGVRIASQTNHTRNFTFEGAAEYRLDDKAYSNFSYHLAVVKPVDGKVRVVLDPKKLRPSERPAQVRVKGLKAEYARLQEPWRLAEQRTLLSAEELKAESVRTAAKALIARMKGQLEKELAWLGWADAAFTYPYTVPAADAQRILDNIRAGSPVWRLQASLLGGVLEGAGQGTLDSPYTSKALAALEQYQQNLLLRTLYTTLLRAGRYEQLKPIMARIQASSPYSEMTKFALRKVGGMELLTIPGKKLPAFELPDLDDPKKLHTHATLTAKARIYLLDFWASW